MSGPDEVEQLTQERDEARLWARGLRTLIEQGRWEGGLWGLREEPEWLLERMPSESDGKPVRVTS